MASKSCPYCSRAMKKKGEWKRPKIAGKGARVYKYKCGTCGYTTHAR